MMESNLIKDGFLAECNKHLKMKLRFAESGITVMSKSGDSGKKNKVFINSGDQFLLPRTHSQGLAHGRH